uniref:Uncharacterized protein n=1 Tax=Esox lucius TaxID=8010 RepID=A0A3P8ZXQ6_ESOLU
MESYHDLSDFQCGLIVGEKFGFSCNTISRLYREYKNSGKTSNLRQQWGRKKTVGERDQHQLARIVSCDRHAILPQITSALNAGPSTNIRQCPRHTRQDTPYYGQRNTQTGVLPVPPKSPVLNVIKHIWDAPWNTEIQHLGIQQNCGPHYWCTQPIM